MASILNSLDNLDMHGSIIDCNWYYGCLFSPKKSIGIDEFLSVAACNDDAHIGGNGEYHLSKEDEKSEQCSVADNDARIEQIILKEENYNNISTNLCFGLSDSDSAEMCSKYYIDDEAECLASMFSVLDEDGDGRVSVDEMVRFLERLGLGMPKEEVELAVRSVSASGDDFLTAIEFNDFYRIVFADKEEEVDNVKVEEQTICEAFDVFDQNGDGFISAVELADVLCRLGFVEGRDVNCCQSMIEGVDYNGDGFVDIHEFKHLITRNSTSPAYSWLQCVAAVN